MDKKENRVQSFFFFVIALLPLGLAFNENIWFDEAYTLALIRHNFSDVVAILKTDMHPPLYFLSLKLFCCVFGYSVFSTKVFSALGYCATVLLGSRTIRKSFDFQTALMFALSVAAMPMLFYFAVQQRSYSWCVFFVTMCFLQAVIAIRERSRARLSLMAVFGLFAAYNHFFALFAVAIIFGFVNIFYLIKTRSDFKFVLLADLIAVAGYSFWMIPLLTQARGAADEFWLKGVEPLSVVVFALSAAVVGALLAVRENRRVETVFAAVCALVLQAAGLLGTLLVRPFFIARYSVVIAGIGACFIAFCFKGLRFRVKKAVAIALCVLFAVNYSFTMVFEYNSSMDNFRRSFSGELKKDDTFLYFDSAFGIISYYYPDNRHICAYHKDWFDAFENVECVDKNDIKNVSGGRIWIVKSPSTKIPDSVKEGKTLSRKYSFRCDFNVYEVWSLSEIPAEVSEK